MDPAEAYAAARRRAAHPHLAAFAGLYPFELDDFQLDACRALEGGHGVLVCAPTGAGKTVVGEFAVHLALAEGRTCAYTTPIKALSNQKYADLVERYGPAKVGLLTGDNSINPGAPVVVMTTEVLRNMLYVGSRTLDDLGYVVMDEVHYLADRFRGAVWEEVIIHLDPAVRLVSLSATVSNAEEFGQWLQTVRGDTTVVVTEHRPVPLWQHMLVGARVYDLFAGTAGQTFDDRGAEPVVNPSLVRATRTQLDALESHRGGRPRRWHPPYRADVVARLDAAGLLPAIVFVFSRAGCDAAVEQCVRSGLRLLDSDERAEVRRVVEQRCASVPDADRQVLGFWEWLDGLERGFGAHHAGLIPVFKETVEELFTRGLCKVVFATETLALGINMPARTVVLERMVKFDGDTHNRLTPGEYTQLTGRAGRRGIDIEGHAVVQWGPEVSPKEVAGLASARTYPLRSSFRPSYNMAVNLVERMGRAEGRRLLEASFAQFQADRGVVDLRKEADRAAAHAAGLSADVSCEHGDVAEYAELRRRLTDLERGEARERSARRRAGVAASVAALRPGDVIAIPSGRRRGLAVVLAADGDTDDPQLRVVTEGRWSGRVPLGDFPDAVTPLTRLKVPRTFNPRAPQARKDLVREMHKATRDLRVPRRRPDRNAPDERIAAVREELRSHPVHGCPDRDDHVRRHEQVRQAHRRAEQLRDRVEGRTTSLGRTFDAICDVLLELGYLRPGGADGEADGYDVTADGRMLSRLWSEADLLVADCLRHGRWDGLSAPELAAVCAATLYESRGGEVFDTHTVPLGSKRVRTALGATVAAWRDVAGVTRRHGAPVPREPDPGFCLAVHRWTAGDSLDTVLRTLAAAGVEVPPGDFVRWCRQVLDLLDQIQRLPDRGGDPARPVVSDALVRTAADAAARIRRGVVGDLSTATVGSRQGDGSGTDGAVDATEDAPVTS